MADLDIDTATTHSIRWDYDAGDVTATAICHAEPGADCRLTSTTCECEEWGEIRRRDDGTIWHRIVGGTETEPQWHQVVPQDDCNVCLFINDSGCPEEFGGNRYFTIAETPIRPVWLVDGCDWEPATSSTDELERLRATVARVEALCEEDARARRECRALDDCGCSTKDCYECGEWHNCRHGGFGQVRAALGGGSDA
ncbi:hypothetical protein [Nocardioides sp. GY 10127]|uniref:hypothetical protein n=1 Tax=Nocardioides sp. GY 10127 TaxID=2569762 RepID=UPI0010A8BFD2|nr:hypothetical protein [Nocardioides sp. GY 10127]TIC78793.1 hypothetical protein E8D37_19040 [Nocardioides sp. GY 10127]